MKIRTASKPHEAGFFHTHGNSTKLFRFQWWVRLFVTGMAFGAVIVLLPSVSVAQESSSAPAAAAGAFTEGRVIGTDVGDQYVAVLMNTVKSENTYGVVRDGRFLALELRVTTEVPREDGILVLMSVNPPENKRLVLQGDVVREYSLPPTPVPTPAPTPRVLKAFERESATGQPGSPPSGSPNAGPGSPMGVGKPAGQASFNVQPSAPGFQRYGGPSAPGSQGGPSTVNPFGQGTGNQPASPGMPGASQPAPSGPNPFGTGASGAAAPGVGASAGPNPFGSGGPGAAAPGAMPQAGPGSYGTGSAPQGYPGAAPGYGSAPGGYPAQGRPQPSRGSGGGPNPFSMMIHTFGGSRDQATIGAPGQPSAAAGASGMPGAPGSASPGVQPAPGTGAVNPFAAASPGSAGQVTPAPGQPAPGAPNPFAGNPPAQGQGVPPGQPGPGQAAPNAFAPGNPVAAQPTPAPAQGVENPFSQSPQTQQ
jgi:hypothetical protein